MKLIKSYPDANVYYSMTKKKYKLEGISELKEFDTLVECDEYVMNSLNRAIDKKIAKLEQSVLMIAEAREDHPVMAMLKPRK